MRRILAAVPVLWLATAVLSAADKSDNADKPEKAVLCAPTKKEAAEGWIALFDGESTLGWHAPNGSKWTISGGMLAPQADTPGLLVTTSAFRDYELVVEYRRRPDSKVELFIDSDRNGKISGGGIGKNPAFKEAPEPPKPDPVERPKKEPTEVRGSPVDLQYMGSDWAELRLKVVNGTARETSIGTIGRAYRIQSAQELPGDVKVTNHVGHIALSGNGVVFRSIKLRPLNQKPIFNGKDLTGWKPFAGDKPKVQSTFTVTKEGWLALKNGPGDLQTEGQWADFIFQGECRTNGKNLNSGIFFRCLPGEYQNGYEAQIHNGFGEKPKKYTVEDYDPKTHELKGKREVESNAVDYGTGAIYRRVPARLSVAKDGEWFTMTIVAQGNHVATWVDGVQVVDWSDNRPLKDNARNGCRLEKGPISLQGHDATTDLNFRKLSVADLAAPEEKKKE